MHVSDKCFKGKCFKINSVQFSSKYINSSVVQETANFREN